MLTLNNNPECGKLYSIKYGIYSKLWYICTSKIKTKMRKTIIDRIKDDPVLQGMIAEGLNRKLSTVERWLLTGHEMLTSPAVLSIVKDRLKINDDSEIIEPIAA